MINRKAIGYITANYTCRTSSKLTECRPLPVFGRYRLIDFPLSNMMNAGIKTVGVVMPSNYRSLIDHMESGRDWMLDRKKGGLFLLPGNAFGASKRGMRFLLRDIIANKTLRPSLCGHVRMQHHLQHRPRRNHRCPRALWRPCHDGVLSRRARTRR